MKNILIIVLILCSLFLVSGCLEESPNGGSVVCNTPYIRFEAGCCLDKNGNAVCDVDENNITEELIFKINDEDELKLDDLRLPFGKAEACVAIKRAIDKDMSCQGLNETQDGIFKLTQLCTEDQADEGFCEEEEPWSWIVLNTNMLTIDSVDLS